MTLEKLVNMIMEFKKEVDNKFENLKEYVDKGFKEVNSRIDGLKEYVDNRFDKLELCPTIAQEIKNLN